MLRIPINEQGWGLFARHIRDFARSEVGPKAVGLFALLIAMLFGINGLNIVNSYVGRDFMTAIADRDMAEYLRQAFRYIAVFAASTVVAVFLRYAEELLGLLWREWMTRRYVRLYMQYPTYYRMNDALMKKAGIEHPDQRIADDVRTFTTTTLSFTLMLLNGTFTVVAFSGVLWSISPLLFGVAVIYATIGSYFTVVLGHTLVDLNYAQLDKEASFRSSLIQVRERAESVALLHREGWTLARLLRQFGELATNFRHIILINRKLGFFTTGYNYLVQIIPALIVAPLFIEGHADFGVVTQSAMAFAMLIGAFSLIVTQFQSISSFAAVIQRLINLWYAIELAQTETVAGTDLKEDPNCVAFENLTLLSAADRRTLVRDLSVSIPRGTRVLVAGPDDAAKNALFKATAGIFDTGQGRITRPGLDRILFLPERPYLPPGTLREVLAPGGEVSPEIPDATIIETLHALNLDSVLSRAGGLDVERDWENVLSLTEQQLLSFARILLTGPAFAFLQRGSADLKPAEARRMLQMLSDRNISYITLGWLEELGPETWSDSYDAVLELKPEGQWEWKDIRPAESRV